MLQIIRVYVQKTDIRRSHLQELRRIDAESADEIRKNEERINKEEELIRILNTSNDDLLHSRTEKIKFLEIEEKELKIKFIKVRKSLKGNLSLDEKQLRFLTAVSNETLNNLSALVNKGGHLLAFSNTCQKFETEREKITKLLPLTQIEEISESSDLIKEEDICQEVEKTGNALTDDEKLSRKVLEKGFSLPKLTDNITIAALIKEQKVRPKTAIPSRFMKSATSAREIDSAEYVSTPETRKIAPIEEVKIEAKKNEEKTERETSFSSSSSKISVDGEKDFLGRCYESLEKLENFWITYNKVTIDIMELKKEQKVLDNENKQLRGIIRAVLEAAALAKSIPDSRVSTRAPSQRRSAYSAPLRRIIFN